MYLLFLSTSILTALLSLLISFFVLAKNRKSPVNIRWSVVCFLTALWSGSLAGVITSANIDDAYRWQMLLNVTAIFIPAVYFDFVSRFIYSDTVKRFLLPVYGIALVLSLFSFSSAFIAGLAPQFDFPFWIVPGSLYYIFPLYFALTLLAIIITLWKSYRAAGGFMKERIKFIFITTVVGFGAGITNFLPQLFGIYPFGNFFTWIYVPIVTYYLLKFTK